MSSFGKFSPRNFDWVLFAASALLIALGMAAIYSVDLSRGNELVLFRKQAIALGLGLMLFILASSTQHTFYKTYAKHGYWLSLILLILVLFFGQTIRGTRGWFVFGGFSFQPVEFAKVGIILILAHITSRFGRRFERPLFFLGTGAVALLPIFLVFLQPDLGSAMLIGLIWFGIMALVGAKKTFIVAFIVLVALSGVLGWKYFFEDYQRERIMAFIDPSRDPLESGYNVTQSIIAIGAGEALGRGLGFGSQSQLRFLPEAQTDFVFSVIGEELGFAGTSVIILLFGVMFWRMIIIIKKSGDDFVSTAISGVLILFFGQFTVNMGANLGLLPVTGVTLPLVSYGGSSLIISLLLLGIVESMVGREY